MDRGYARVSLLVLLRRLGIPYLIRGCRNTMVVVGGQRMLLGRVRYREGQAARYVNVAYQDEKRERIDVVVYHDPNFQEPWYLLVSPDTEGCLPTEVVVDLFRQRMYIELTFRDWKTHLGIRGLHLEVDIDSLCRLAEQSLLDLLASMCQGRGALHLATSPPRSSGLHRPTGFAPHPPSTLSRQETDFVPPVEASFSEPSSQA